MDSGVFDPAVGRLSAHSMSAGFFVAGAILAWCKLSGPHSMGDAIPILAIAWFPPVIAEVFRRLPVSNPTVAAALLSGIAGYDGVVRLLMPWGDGGC